MLVHTDGRPAARVSLGLCGLTGMLASTCLAVLFVPSFFTLLQRFEERRKPVKTAPHPPAAAAPAAGD